MSHTYSYESALCMGYSIPREVMLSLGRCFGVRCATYMYIWGYAYAGGHVEFKFQQCIHIVGWAEMNFLQVHNSATCTTYLFRMYERSLYATVYLARIIIFITFVRSYGTCMHHVTYSSHYCITSPL
jgi:hypothetical protein